MKSAKLSVISARSALLAAALLTAAPASAHTILVSPPPISPVDSAKVGPCGCEFGGDPACPADFQTTDLNAGDALLIKWKETVQHTGKFRLAFSTKPPDQVTAADFDANVIYEKADANSVAGATISTTITVPDTPCDPCTIQLRQFMEGAPSPYYFSCASVRVLDPAATSSSASTGSGSGSGGVGGDPTGGSGQGGHATNGEGGSTGPGLAEAPTPIATGSCSASGASPGAVTLFVIGALGLASRLPRSRSRRRGRSA